MSPHCSKRAEQDRPGQAGEELREAQQKEVWGLAAQARKSHAPMQVRA